MLIQLVPTPCRSVSTKGRSLGDLPPGKSPDSLILGSTPRKSSLLGQGLLPAPLRCAYTSPCRKATFSGPLSPQMPFVETLRHSVYQINFYTKIFNQRKNNLKDVSPEPLRNVAAKTEQKM